MGFLSELRHPTAWYSKLVIAVVALAFFVTLTGAAISAYLVHRLITPSQSPSEINLQNFPGHPQTLTYNIPQGGSRDGWFFPGLKTAPTIVLCPAYQSSRGELLTLASALQDHQYNVLLFDFSAHGSSGGRSSLGYQEVGELRAAMDAVAKRGDVDPNHFGLWGVSLGAYVSLSEAISDPRVRAVVVGSVYDDPEDMVRLSVARSGLGSFSLITKMTQMGFHWMYSQYGNVPRLTTHISKLAGVAQLYIASPEDPALAASTTDIFRASPPPHELVVLPSGNYAAMVDDEKRNYENRIVSFFLGSLPAIGGAPSQQ